MGLAISNKIHDGWQRRSVIRAFEYVIWRRVRQFTAIRKFTRSTSVLDLVTRVGELSCLLPEPRMDLEEQTRVLLSPTTEGTSSIKIFPYIRALKKDVIVSEVIYQHG